MQRLPIVKLYQLSWLVLASTATYLDQLVNSTSIQYARRRSLATISWLASERGRSALKGQSQTSSLPNLERQMAITQCGYMNNATLSRILILVANTGTLKLCAEYNTYYGGRYLKHSSWSEGIIYKYEESMKKNQDNLNMISSGTCQIYTLVSSVTSNLIILSAAAG